MSASRHDETLLMATGRTWAEIAAEHDMRCGGCRGGILELQTVHVEVKIDHTPLIKALTADTSHWREPFTIQPFTIQPPQKAVTLDLRCERCGREVSLPMHTREV